MSDARFPHRVMIVGEASHARVEDGDVVIYGPHLRHRATIANAEALYAELEAALCQACEAAVAPGECPRSADGQVVALVEARPSCGERIGPGATGSDPASINPAIAPCATKPARDGGPSVHLFATMEGRR